jgi:tyrosinase
MKFSSVVTAALAGGVVAVPFESRATFESDALAKQGAANLAAYVKKNGYPNAKCTLENVAVRKEWYVFLLRLFHRICSDTPTRSTLSTPEKTNYIKAVNCLAKKAPKTPAGIAAGAKNRYDDFVVTHINQTLSIHGTVRCTPHESFII